MTDGDGKTKWEIPLDVTVTPKAILTNLNKMKDDEYRILSQSLTEAFITGMKTQEYLSSIKQRR